MIGSEQKILYVLSVILFVVLLFSNQYILDDLLGVYDWKIQLGSYFFCSLLSCITFLLLHKKKYVILFIATTFLAVVYIYMFSTIDRSEVMGTAWETMDNDSDELVLYFIDRNKAEIRSNEGVTQYDYIISNERLELSEAGVIQEYSIELREEKLKLIQYADTIVFYRK